MAILGILTISLNIIKYNVDRNTSPVSARVDTAAGYTVRLWDGKIAIFEETDPDTPIQVTDIAENTLTSADAALLTEGIAVKDRTELLQILEDYGS